METRRWNRFSRIALFIASMVATGRANPVQAAYTFFDTQSSFLAGASSAGTPVASTEGFDEFSNLSTFSSPLSLGGVTYTTPGAPAPPSTYEAVGGAFWPPESGPNVLVLTTGFVPAELWFGGGSVRAFGLALSAPTSTSGTNPLLYEAEIFEADGSRHDTALLLTNPGLNYLSFVETVGSPGIAEVGILVSPGTSAVAFDDVSHSAVTPGSFGLITPRPFDAVPEPGSWALLAMGLGVVACFSLMGFLRGESDGKHDGRKRKSGTQQIRDDLIAIENDQ